MRPVFLANTVVELYMYETYQQIFPYSIVLTNIIHSLKATYYKLNLVFARVQVY